MSDTRTQAIRKAATELVEELLSASAKEGSERWFHIIVRKMEQVPDRCPPKEPDPKRTLLAGNAQFDQSKLGMTISSGMRGIMSIGGGLTPEVVREHFFIPAAELPKLKLWLNGE